MALLSRFANYLATIISGGVAVQGKTREETQLTASLSWCQAAASIEFGRRLLEKPANSATEDAAPLGSRRRSAARGSELSS